MSKNNRISDLTIIKYKRKRTTYVLGLNLKTKSKVTLKYLKEQLLESILKSGGLLLEDENDERPKSHESDEDIDVEVPKSEFIDEESTDQGRITNITIDDIQIAVPKDKTDPYSDNWVEIADDQMLGKLDFKDNDIFAFKYQEEDFRVVEATYNE